MTSRNWNEPIIVDAIYDDIESPSITELAKHPPLERPLIDEDGSSRLVVALPEPAKSELPNHLRPADLHRPPFRHAGRLNVHWSSADEKVHGSAQFVAPGLLLTAGHCIHWSGQWNKNLYFLQRYEQGRSDMPVFKIDKIGVLSGWLEQTGNDDPPETAWAYDFAILRIQGAQKTGYVPLEPLSDEVRSMTSLGYPSKYGEGHTMYHCEGERKPGRYDGTVGLQPSHMAFGASGGAWFTGEGDQAQAIGLNSFKMPNTPDLDYSPLLGKAAMGLLHSMTALDSPGHSSA